MNDFFNKKFVNAKVQEIYNILKTYDEDKNLDEFDIIHLYPKGKVCYPDGYYDSQWFDFVAFNTVKKKFRRIENRDAIRFNLGKYKLHLLKVFCDGSFIVRFLEFITFNFIGQAITLERKEK